jgi:hypothetical protein
MIESRDRALAAHVAGAVAGGLASRAPLATATAAAEEIANAAVEIAAEILRLIHERTTPDASPKSCDVIRIYDENTKKLHGPIRRVWAALECGCDDCVALAARAVGEDK